MAKDAIKLTRLQQIAEGGIAILTLAVQPDGTQLVVRELKPALKFHWRMRKRFAHGTAVRNLLSPHPNIIFSVETGRDGMIPYEVIEFVPGFNLDVLIRTEKDYIQYYLVEIMQQAAAALAHVHAKKMVHLDVKAQNFMIDTTTPKPRVKLTDFDLCKQAGTPRDRKNPGTVAYMAPETFQKGEVSRCSDIFAYGVMAYYAATGTMPFSETDRDAVLKQRLDRDNYRVMSPAKINPQIHQDLAAIILRCLAHDPRQRYGNMAGVMEDLAYVI